MTIEQYEKAIDNPRIRKKIVNRKLHRFMTAQNVPRRVNGNKLGLKKRSKIFKKMYGIEEKK